jgi:triosephosphate isomerase
MIFAANFKTNHTRATTQAYIDGLNKKLETTATDNDIYIFPPATALDSYETTATV